MAGSRRLNRLAASVLERTKPNLPDGDLVVAISGGADSAVCAWAAVRLAPRVRTVHVNHGWPASNGLEKAARAVAEELDLDCTVVDAQVRSGPSPEAQARLARYEALDGALEPGEWLLTGHTADDQVETILGNLLRGSGASGVIGMPRRRDRMVRPLLDVSRTETRELAELLGLRWVDDPANLDTALRRNQLRREIIPYLRARLNPSLPIALLRLSAALEEDESYLGELGDDVPIQIDEAGARLPAPLLASLPEAVAVRAVRRALRAVYGGYPGTSAEVAAVLDVARGEPPVDLTRAIRVERRGASVILSRGRADTAGGEAAWILPGTLGFGSWTLEAWIEEAQPVAFPLSPYVEVFDADRLPASLVVRAGLAADRITIRAGTKAVPDVLAEAKIPHYRRAAWPVVLASGRVIWVPGVRRADAGWVGSTTRRYLWVRATLEGNP